MLDIFLYNENLWFVNVNFNIFDNYISNDFLWDSYLSDNFYFDNLFFKNNKKYYYSWTTMSNKNYFISYKYYTSLSSHSALHWNSYIFWKPHKIFTLITMDYPLKNIFFLLNLIKNDTTLFYVKKNVSWEFFFDEFITINFLDISKNTEWSYFTSFDFKKKFLGIPLELYKKKFVMLYYYNCLDQFSFFFKELFIDINFLLKRLNFENFGIYFFKDKFIFESFFFLKNLIYFFLMLNKNYFFDIVFLDFKFFEILKFFVKLREKNGYLYFFFDYDYYYYLYFLNFIKVDIFLNSFSVNYNIFYKTYDYFRASNLYDLSISNIHLYNKSSNFMSVYSLELTKYGKFFNITYINHISDNLKLNFIVKDESIFYYLKYYLFYYDFDYDFDYFSYFYKNLDIKHLYFTFSIIKIKIYFFIINCLLFFFLCLFFIFYFLNLYYNINLKFNFIKSLNYLNWLLIWFILYLNYSFKNSKIYYINSDLKFTQKISNFNKILFNFDLILYIYIKFIIVYFGSLFKDNYNLLRTERIYIEGIAILNNKKSFFLFKNFIFLIIFYLFLLIFIVFFFFYYLNLLLLLNLYKIYYTEYLNSFRGNFKLLFNFDGNISNMFDFTYLYTLKWYLNFFNYWINYYKMHYFFKFTLKFFVSSENEKKSLFREFYSNLYDRGLFLFWTYSTIFISFLFKRDFFVKFRYFFVYRLYYEFLHYIKDLQTNMIALNIFSFLRVSEFKIGSFFSNLNIFKFNSKLFLFDYSLLDLIKKKKSKYLSSNIYLNLEFENLILKPITKFFIYIFFNNILIIFIFFTKFLKYFKLELYLKSLFFYVFQLIYIFFCFKYLKQKYFLLNLKYIYVCFSFFSRVKYLILIFFEILFNKVGFYIFKIFNKFKFILLLIFFFSLFFNLNLLNFFLMFIPTFFTFFDYIYIYFFFCEIFFFIFEVLFIQNILDYVIKFYSNFIIFDNFSNYFLDYKVWVLSWLNLLVDYELSFESMSTRKAYAINARWLVFNEYKDSFYAWIPSRFIHTFVRFIYVIIWNKEPEFWFHGMHYFQNFFRLGWDFLGSYVSRGSKYSILEHFINGFFKDSVYHSYYLGFNLNNFLYNYKFISLVVFFKSKIFFLFMYVFFYIYFCFEFLFYKFFFNLIYFINNFIIYFIYYFESFKNVLIWTLYIIYYSIIYLFYMYFFTFFYSLYLVLYNVFLIHIFLNFFLFSYNIFFYYQETLYTFLNMDIDFIKQNIFNYKYRLTEDWHPFGTWPTYVYKFEQYTWIDNIFKEYFLRNLIYYEWKNLFFFKTFYTFYMNINRITFFIFLVYLYFLFKIFIYFLSFINKWFFFTFFNNDWSITRNPAFTWDKWKLLSKDSSYYFNEGIFHILGGNIIWNHFYFFNHNLDNYIFEKKNNYISKFNQYHFEKNLKYNNLLFFENQLNITKNIWNNTILKNDFFNWNINSLLFFKNYQFFWYKNLDFILIKYEDLYGDYSRSWVDKYNKNYFTSLDIDKYNYLVLPNSARITYTHLFTKEWLFYKDLPKHKRFMFLNFNKYKYKNLLNNKEESSMNSNSFIYYFKNYNIDDLFYTRLQYPFLMFWITSKELNLNQNLKYLFPFLIQKKEIWSLYNDLFLQEKKEIENKASVPMSAEWLSFFNTSSILPYLTILSRIDFNLKYTEENYKGVWNSVEFYDRDLFLNYIGWENLLVKYPTFDYLPFWDEFSVLNKFENTYYQWLHNINKRYFSYFLSVFHRSEWFYYPRLYEQNLFKNLKYQSYDFSDDFDYINSSGMINYFKESRLENIEDPYTKEEWENIFRDYTENAFFYGDDGIILMLLYRENIIDNVTSNINFMTSFLFFFVPLYTYVIGNEIYYELGAGFIFQGGLEQPIDTSVVVALERYLTLSDFDMQDERYFYINVIEQELIDFFIRTYQEMFYNFTKYFNGFEYLNFVKKNSILLNDDILLDKLYDRRMYKNVGRLFKSFLIDDENPEDTLEEIPSWFLMQERKPFYIFSDLSYNIPNFSIIGDNNNLFLLIYNFIFLKNYISDLYFKKWIFIEIFDFLKNINSLNLNNNLLNLKNLYFNNQNIFNFFYYYLININNNNYFVWNIQNYYESFYYFYFNKNIEYKFWFDSYFSWNNKFIKYYFHYNMGSGRFEPILAFYNNNSYLDILGHRLEIYKNFNKNNELFQHYTYLLKWNVFFDDYSSNYSRFRTWKFARRSFKSIFINPIRIYLMNAIDMEWFFKVRFLPITTFYLKFFDASYIYINNYFLMNYLSTLNIYNNFSNLYIDKSTLLSEKNNLWQFQLSLSESNGRNFSIFPFFEFFLYFSLLFIIYFFFFFLIHCFKLEYVINKNYYTIMYYDKINDIWVDFKYYKKNKK